MSGRTPLTIVAGLSQRLFLGKKMPAPSRCPLRRESFRPCALGIAGLVIAVTLWAVGCKLSLYHQHASPESRVPLAQLWIESRDASEPAVSRINGKSHQVPGSQLFSVLTQRLPRLSRGVAYICHVCTLDFAYFYSLPPLRSPPSISLL